MTDAFKNSSSQSASVQLNSDGSVPVSLLSALAGVLSGVENDTILVAAFRRSDAFQASLESSDITSAVTVKAGTTSKSVYITDVSISTNVAGWIKLQDSAGSPVTIVPKKYLPANSVWSKHYTTPILVAVGLDLKAIGQNAGNISVEVEGYVL